VDRIRDMTLSEAPHMQVRLSISAQQGRISLKFQIEV
jgi:hypothetical protein